MNRVSVERPLNARALADTSDGVDEVGVEGLENEASPPETSSETGEEVISQPAFDEIRALSAEGHHERALEKIAAFRQRFPGITDRLAKLEGDVRLSLDPDERACLAFAKAIESPHRDFALEARVARVRCLIETGDRQAEKAVTDLRRRYPRLPQTKELRYLLARARERSGGVKRAIVVYRDFDLKQPASGLAADSRRRLEVLSAHGVSVPPLTKAQQVARAQRLVQAGSFEMARQEINALRDTELPRLLARKVTKVAANLARRQGNDDEARALHREASGLPPETPEQRSRRVELELAKVRAGDTGDPDNGRRTIRRLIGKRPISVQPSARLLAIVHVGARAGLADEVNEALDGLLQRSGLSPQILFKAGLFASGVGDDERVSKVFAALRQHPRHGLASRYHRARAEERLGHFDEALAEYEQLIDKDRGDTPYYAFWARQRRSVIETALTEGGEIPSHTVQPNESESPVAETAAKRRRTDPRAFGDELAQRLREITKKHDGAFPWFPRAADLLELGQFDEAADELHEAFLAWHDANGSDAFRSGFLSVYRDTPVPRHQAGPTLLAQRRALDEYDLEQLANLCAEIGEHGLTVRFGGWPRANDRPRAYETSVMRAAERHDVDPDLLFAVMRVESFYSRRIISYAGAIGLTQVMPRTGQFIALQQGHDRFTVDQLLDPDTNVDYGAWYLAMLIDRFDGRIPLAIAAYNGGPYAVRRWLREQPAAMPIESFLELIPFSQTHRYVRRVLTHYEVYRARRGETPPTMGSTLPTL